MPCLLYMSKPLIFVCLCVHLKSGLHRQYLQQESVKFDPCSLVNCILAACGESCVLFNSRKLCLTKIMSYFEFQVGVVFINVPLWITGIRKAPKLTGADWIRLAPIGLFAAGAHGGSVLALGGGSVTFAQIVKACEPVGSFLDKLIRIFFLIADRWTWAWTRCLLLSWPWRFPPSRPSRSWHTSCFS